MASEDDCGWVPLEIPHGPHTWTDHKDVQKVHRCKGYKK